mmetsp:Transcript_31400/g.76959  ORF Transcript_31400/g.76959 Transcript_31400/m.76959 type:complete len:222 (-) Transcript_31400:593-1258(-)
MAAQQLLYHSVVSCRNSLSPMGLSLLDKDPMAGFTPLGTPATQHPIGSAPPSQNWRQPSSDNAGLRTCSTMRCSNSSVANTPVPAHRARIQSFSVPNRFRTLSLVTPGSMLTPHTSVMGRSLSSSKRHTHSSFWSPQSSCKYFTVFPLPATAGKKSYFPKFMACDNSRLASPSLSSVNLEIFEISSSFLQSTLKQPVYPFESTLKPKASISLYKSQSEPCL